MSCVCAGRGMVEDSDLGLHEQSLLKSCPFKRDLFIIEYRIEYYYSYTLRWSILYQGTPIAFDRYFLGSTDYSRLHVGCMPLYADCVERVVRMTESCALTLLCVSESALSTTLKWTPP